jgi:AraC-like DNA-binding protein
MSILGARRQNEDEDPGVDLENFGERGRHLDIRRLASLEHEATDASDGGSAGEQISPTIGYLLEKEGDALTRLRRIATKLGLALTLCDEKGRSIAIEAPVLKLMCGGISPKVLQRVCAYIDKNLDKNIELAHLARVTGLSKCHFARAFKQSIGITPHYYVMRKRVEYASMLLRETDIPLTQIALRCGFSDQSHLCRRFRMIFNSTPRAFRRWHR